jgi:hypothetical protein
VILCRRRKQALQDILCFCEPAVIENLANMPLLSMAAPDGRKIWRLNNLSGQEGEVAIVPRFATDDLLTLKGAALDGLGARSFWHTWLPRRLRPAC